MSLREIVFIPNAEIVPAWFKQLPRKLTPKPEGVNKLKAGMYGVVRRYRHTHRNHRERAGRLICVLKYTLAYAMLALWSYDACSTANPACFGFPAESLVFTRLGNCSLLRVLEKGPEAKVVLDAVVNATSAMQVCAGNVDVGVAKSVLWEKGWAHRRGWRPWWTRLRC